MAGQPRRPTVSSLTLPPCSWALRLGAGTSTEAPGGPAPLSAAPRAEPPQLSQGLSLGRNGHQLGVGERLRAGAGEAGNRPLPGLELLAVASFLSCFCFEEEEQSGSRGSLAPPDWAAEFFSPPHPPPPCPDPGQPRSSTLNAFPRPPFLPHRTSTPNTALGGILTLVSAASDFRVLFMISSRRCSERSPTPVRPKPGPNPRPPTS